jgi:glycosyltransferase involved in cell wall biosynthesis
VSWRPGPTVVVAAQGEIGGAERVLLQLLSQVPPAEVVVCAPAGSPLERQAVALGHRVRDLTLPKLAHSPSVAAYARSYLRAVRALHLTVRSEGASVVHGFAAFTLKLVVPVSLITGVPAMVSVHEVTTPRSVGWLRSRAHRLLAGRRVTSLVAVSRYVADTLIASGYPADRVQVLHNGVSRTTPRRAQDDARSQLGLPRDMLVFVVVGRLSRLKGAHLAIDALDRYRRRPGLPAALLVVVGGPGAPEDAGYVQYLEQTVADRGLGAHVRLVGPRSDVEVFYDACDALLVPSVRPDAFPTVVLEAGLAGRPVVASDCGGAPEAIVDDVTGIVVPPTAEAFAAAMARCADPVWRKRAGAAARAHVEETFPLGPFASTTRAQWAAAAGRR